jgi:hypothetical protein
VEAELSMGEGEFARLQHGCITVVPTGAVDTAGFLHQVEMDPGEPALFQFSFLPEVNGIALSGSVHKGGNQEPVAGARIHFSILGGDPDYFVTHSDEEGRFLINTPPRIGKQDMFVVPEPQPDQPVEVRIDNDFAPDPLPFQPDPFTLQQDEHKLASRLSLHMQFEQAYLTKSGTDSAVFPQPEGHVPFYGGPWISVKLDEFINLPNLEEVVENLVPKTYVMRQRGGQYFMIKSDNPMIQMFPQLILVDHLPVFDMEAIMALPPSKIERIDVVPEVYIKGEVKFGGIISITSREGDLGGIKLPEGSYFFDYEYFNDSLIPRQHRISGPGNIPDSRNTLFWMDHLELDADDVFRFDFQAASVPGSYLILFRGVTADGEIVYGLNQFEVE